MKIATWLSDILSKEKPEESIQYLVDEEGIHFKIDADTLSKVIKGEISSLAQAQYLALSMLVEQGLAQKNKTEYFDFCKFVYLTLFDHGLSPAQYILK